MIVVSWLMLRQLVWAWWSVSLQTREIDSFNAYKTVPLGFQTKCKVKSLRMRFSRL